MPLKPDGLLQNAYFIFVMFLSINLYFVSFSGYQTLNKLQRKTFVFFSSLIVGDFDLVTSTQYNHFLFKHSHLLLKCKYNVYNRVWDAG